MLARTPARVNRAGPGRGAYNGAMPVSPFKTRGPLAAVLALGALLVAAVMLWLPSQSPARAPEVTFTLLDGGTRALVALRGRPVLVSFWATTCPPCVEELPDLIRLYEEWKPRGLELIAVAMPYDPPLYVERFVRERVVPYPVALDVQGTVTRAFGVAYVPMAFLVGPDGSLAYQQAGKLDIARLRRMIEAHLPPPPT
jgi:thiol-disulfide isomerase/thioredoxin